MKYLNSTPFKSLLISAADVEDRDFHVVILRGTFYIFPDEKLLLATTQEPLVLTDKFYAEVHKSSVIMESDIALLKPQTDILVSATSYAPGGKPSTRWQAGVKVGAHVKKLAVTGPRYWMKDSSGKWSLSEPEPISSLPLRYEYAYGGTVSDEQDREGRPPSFDGQNPVGMGHCPKWKLDETDKLPAPQIESAEDPVVELGRSYAPQGFGPIGRSWLPRRLRAGTLDDQWFETRWPQLPPDFNFSFYNCAHPDLIVPWLNGDEKVELLNLTPDGRISFELPGHCVVAKITYQDGAQTEIPARLDTLIIDAEDLKANLVWRLTLPEEPVVDKIEMHLNPEINEEVENG